MVAFVLTPDNLQAGSVGSCIFRMPVVQVSSAYLHSLQIPPIMANFTMSRPFPKSRPLRCRAPPPSEQVAQERYRLEGMGLEGEEEPSPLCYLRQGEALAVARSRARL